MSDTDWDDGYDGGGSSKKKANLPASSNLITKVVGSGISQGVILSTILPWLTEKLGRYPKLTKMILLPLTGLTLAPAVMGFLPQIWTYMMSYLMSSMVIPWGDGPLQLNFLRWLAEKKIRILPEKSMTARSSQLSGYKGISDSDKDSVFFRAKGSFHTCTHKRRIFLVQYDEQADRGSDITIWTVGWSPAPIMALLQEISEKYKQEFFHTTEIVVPQHGRDWMTHKTKMQRPLDTVYLPNAVKAHIIKDLEEYLDVNTNQWYTDRGIPYRRGYLLYGRPGCGKSSLAMAVAGHFQLDVYSVSLLDPNLNDATLVTLFRDIPGGGCLVLLEDVDSAGIGRQVETTGVEDEPDKSTKGKGAPKKSSVTLSGLLNAIDGPSAPEAHVLFMTTNCVKSLDPALVRAGRADVWIEFKYADKPQIRDIFLAMYKPRVDRWKSGLEADKKKDYKGDDDPGLEVLADRFAELVPDFKFSPAQLQNYLLLHKKSATDAVESVAAWVDEELKLNGQHAGKAARSRGPYGYLNPPSTAPSSTPETPVGSQSPSAKIFIIDESNLDEACQLTEIVKQECKVVKDINNIETISSAG